tara:strand:+ start:1524 stop:1832 length:309 start_codon:yes stop_codon:yes gene_type:complete
MMKGAARQMLEKGSVPMKKLILAALVTGSIGLAACSDKKEETAPTEEVAVEATDAAPVDMASDAVAGAESDADAMGEMNADAMSEGESGTATPMATTTPAAE